MAEEKSDPIADMLAIDDEQMRSRTPPEAELNVDPPADKQPQERDESGKFKGKDGEKKPEEAKPDDKKPDAKAPEEKPKETVPLATFLEKTNKLKAELEAGNLTTAELRKEIEALKAQLAPKPEAPKEPDFVEDPKGYVDHHQKKLLDAIAASNAKTEESGKKAQETAAQANEQVQLQRFFTDLQAHEQRFVAQNPDYHDALNHVRQVRVAQLKEFHPEITQEQIVQTIRQEETQLAVKLARQGRDPVQTAYNLAKHYGYQSKPKEPEKPAEVAKLPDAPSRRLPPDQTLGSGATEETPVYKEGETDPVDVALASLLKKRA